jgi:hypothetical protein
MESANRILTRRALDTLKSIAVGEYVPPEERVKEAETAPEAQAAEASAEAAPISEESAAEPETTTDDVPSEAESKSE